MAKVITSGLPGGPGRGERCERGGRAGAMSGWLPADAGTRAPRAGQPRKAIEQVQAALDLEQQCIGWHQAHPRREALRGPRQGLELRGRVQGGRQLHGHPQLRGRSAPAPGGRGSGTGSAVACGSAAARVSGGSSSACSGCGVAWASCHVRSMAPRAPRPSESKRTPAGAGSRLKRKTRSDGPARRGRGRNNTPRVRPRSAASCRRTIARLAAARPAKRRVTGTRAERLLEKPTTDARRSPPTTRSSATPRDTSAGAKGIRGGATQTHQRAATACVSAASAGNSSELTTTETGERGSRSGRCVASPPGQLPIERPQSQWEPCGGAALRPRQMAGCSSRRARFGSMPMTAQCREFTSDRCARPRRTRRPQCPR